MKNQIILLAFSFFAFSCNSIQTTKENNKDTLTKEILQDSLNTTPIHEMDEEYQKVIADFISYVKNGQIETIADHIAFPFDRRYPIPSIKNKQEFITRYHEVFDDSLINMVAHSTPNKNWGDMGWRGLMFLDGRVWVDFDGRLLAVNYQSKFEEQKWQELVEEERSGLHESLRKFEAPMYILETSKYRIRIDNMGESYRYASWPLEKKMNEQPDLVIENGEVEWEGTGGNHTYHFKNNGYTYDCSIIEMGEEDAPPAYLSINEGDKEVLSQKATIVTR